MSQSAASEDNSPTPEAGRHEKLPITAGIIIGIAGLFFFLASQVCIVTGAAIWSIGGYFHLGLTGFAILSAILVPVALYACWKILVMAISAERDPENG